MKRREERTKFFSKILVFIMIFQLFTPFLEISTVSAKSEKNTIIDKLEIVGGVPEEGYWPGDLIIIKGDWSLLDDSFEHVYGDGYSFTVEIPEGFTPIGNIIILGNMGQGEINKENNTIEFTFNENINHKIDRKGGFNLHLKVDGPENGFDKPEKKDLTLKERSDGEENSLDIKNLGGSGNEIVINEGKRPEPESSDDVSALHKSSTAIQYAIADPEGYDYEKDKVKWHIDINSKKHNMVGFKKGILEDSVVNDNHEIDEDSLNVTVEIFGEIEGHEDLEEDKKNKLQEKIQDELKTEILESIKESNKKGFKVELKNLDKYRYIIRYKTQYIGDPMLDMNSDDYSMEKGILNLKNKVSLTPIGDEGEAIENHTTGELLLNGWAKGQDLVKFKLEKKDSFNKDISLSGAEFELYFYDNFIKGDREDPIKIKDNNDGVYKIVSTNLDKELPIFDTENNKLVNKPTKVVDINGNILPGRYVLVETKAPEGYELDMEPKFIDIEADDDGKFVYEVENTPSVDIKINKNWENFEGKNLEKELREDVVVSVFKNEDQNPVRRGVLQKDQDSIEFKNLPAYDEDGNTIEYRIEEETKLDNFEEPVIDKENTESVKDGHEYYQEYTVTNKMKEPKGNFTLKKVDVENKNVIKGSEFKLTQIEDKNKETLNKVIEGSIVLEDGFKELKDLEIGKYKLEEIKAPENYKKLDNFIEFEVDNRGDVNLISEDPLLEFSKDENELKVSNIALIDISVTKEWDGLAREKAEIKLFADKKEIGSVELNKDNSWTHTFSNLDKTDKNGNEIKYEVKEVNVPDNYETEISGNVEDGFVVTNEFIPKKISIDVKKEWDGLAREKAEVELYADGKKIDDVELNKDNKWTHTFSNLDKTDKYGKEIEYEVKEVNVPGNYETEISGNVEEGFIVTNEFIPEKINIDVEKEWIGLPGEKAEVELYADGKKIDDVELNKDNKWTHTFSDLDKTDKYGKEIEYEVEEVNVPGNYETDISGSAEEGFKVTNTFIPEERDIVVEKVWDGLEGEKAKIELFANDEKVDNAELSIKNDWKHTFEGLKSTDIDGNLIDYRVEEVEVPDNYEVSYKETSGHTLITNTFIPEKIDIKVEKKWDGLVGEKAEVELYADGKKIDSVKLNEGNDWTHTFSDLDKTDKYGNKIEYEVNEVNVPGNYETDISGSAEKGFIVTNEFIPEKISIDVEKEWIGLPGEKAEIKLFADKKEAGSVELNEGNNWTHTFSNLDKTDKNGNEIKYEVKEVNVPDNYKTEISGNIKGGFIVTNEFIPEKINIDVEKEWIGLPGEKAEVELYADGKKIDDVELNKDNKWTHTFSDLDKTDKYGKEINYEIKEVNVPGNYESTVEGNKDDGFIVKNTYIPEKRDLHIEKIWDGKPQDEASFILYKDNEKYSEEVVLNKENNWKYIFEDLETTDIDGNPIKYHVKEVDVPGNYEVSYKETSDGIAIINSFIPEKTEVSVRKLWEGRKLDKVRVELIGNREVVDVVTLSNSNNWQHTFNNVDKTDKFENPIYYTVREIDVPEGYTVSYEGGNKDFTITNKETMPIPPIEKIDLEVEKKWDGKVLDQVEVELLADGSVVDRVKLSESNDWVYKFEDLDATDIDGTEIEYEVRETNVPEGYRVDYKRIDNKFIITNTEEQLNEKIDIKVIKKWLDSNGRDLTKSYKAPKIQDKALELPAISNDSDLKEELPIKEEKIEEIKKDEFEEDIENNEEIKLETEELEEELIDEVPEEIKVDEDIEDRSEPDVEKISYTTIKDNVSEDELRDLEKSLDIEEVEEINLPESIEVTLKANGKVLKTVRVKKSDNWEYIFKNLDKYDENGNEIKYTISETPVEGFKTTYSKDGFTIINIKTDKPTDPVEPTDPEDNDDHKDEGGENKPHYPTPEDNEKDPGTTKGENKPGNTTKPNKPNDMGSPDNSKKPQKVDKPNQSINKGSLPATGSKSQIGTYILGVSMILLGIALRRKNK